MMLSTGLIIRDTLLPFHLLLSDGSTLGVDALNLRSGYLRMVANKLRLEDCRDNEPMLDTVSIDFVLILIL